MPSITSVNIGGTFRTTQFAYARVSGAWRRATQIWVNISGTWSKAHDDWLSSVSPASFDGLPNQTILSPFAATASGGKTPYFYGWVKLTGSGHVTVDNPFVAQPTFRADTPGEFPTTWQCTIADSLGNSDAYSVALNFHVGS